MTAQVCLIFLKKKRGFSNKTMFWQNRQKTVNFLLSVFLKFERKIFTKKQGKLLLLKYERFR